MATKRALPRVFYTLNEFAQITGLGYRTVLKMAQADWIPAAKVGASKTYLVPAEFVNAMSDQTMQHFFQQLQARGLIPAAEEVSAGNEEGEGERG